MTAKRQKLVGKMTGDRRGRRKIDGRKVLSAVLTTLLLTLLSDATPVFAAESASWTPTTDIENAAVAFIKEQVGDGTGNTSVSASKLDSRLRLARCNEPLEAFLRPGTEIKDRTAVGVRCNGDKPWKVYVPVDLVVTKNVLTLRQSVSRGHVLTAADLVAVRRDVTRVRRGYFTDPAALIGQKARQSLIAGKIITPSMIEAAALIRRGQTVTLGVANDRLNIRMAGKALSDGALHQRIRVENSSSGRIVEGIVRSRELVEILVAGSDGFF